MADRERKQFNHCLKGTASIRRSREDPWSEITCYVTFDDPHDHHDIVEDYFRYYLRLDIEFMRSKLPGHFRSAHNVARAIAVYHYFRKKFFYFDRDYWEYIDPDELPKREPDAEGETFSFWVSFDEQP